METGTGQSRYSLQQGPVVRRPISANPGLKFSPNFFISLLKSPFREKFPYSFSRTSNNQIVSKKIWTEFSFIAFRREIKFHTNPVLLTDPALNNPCLSLLPLLIWDFAVILTINRTKIIANGNSYAMRLRSPQWFSRWFCENWLVGKRYRHNPNNS